MVEWRTEPLINCLAALIDYRGKSPPKSATGIPVLSAKVVKTTGLLRPIEQKIKPDYYPKWMTRGLPEPGDVVMTTEGPMGQVIQLDEETARFALGQRIVCLRGKEQKLDNTFLRYLLTSPIQQAKLASYATGTTVSGISQRALRSMPISFPDLSEQRRIGQVLSTLDDKIELNRRINETLETMARAMFKDWFVDFGPTRAKAEGHTPYLAPELWKMFPDILDDDGNPKGWIQGILADIADSPKRGVSPFDVPEDTPYIGLGHMPRRSIALADWEGAGQVTSNKSIFKRGEILFGKLRPYFHKVGLAPLDGICSTDIVVVVPRNADWAAFTLACLSSDEFVDYADKTSTGTKMPRTSWKTMRQYRIILPPEHVIRSFQNLVYPLIEAVRTNIHSSRILAQTRDLLLPQLMSGDISFCQAEKMVKDVA